MKYILTFETTFFYIKIHYRQERRVWDWTGTHALRRIDHHAGYYPGISTNSTMHSQIPGGKLISGVPFIMYHPEELQPSVCTVYSVHERRFDTFEALPNETLNSKIQSSQS